MMFTGIVQAVGTVTVLAQRDGDASLLIDVGGLSPERVAPGASVAVNGACLTVTRHEAGRASFDVSRETLASTTLGQLAAGMRVNLEPALTLSEPLGGHMVTGHVDGVGEVATIMPDARSTRVAFRIPAAMLRYVARKGSLCVDGVSLTVNDVRADEADVNLIPHTLQSTIMGNYRVGTRVNIEVDLVARYLERMLEARA